MIRWCFHYTVYWSNRQRTKGLIFSFQQIHPSFGLVHIHRIAEMEMRAECRLKTLARVPIEDIFSASQQLLDLRVALRNPFNDQPPAESREEIRQTRQWHVVRNGQVMDERQREDRVHRAALSERAAVRVGPAPR